MNRMQQIMYDMGVRAHRAGNLPEAEKQLKQALEFDPNEPNVLHLLAMVTHLRGRNDEAMELARKSLAALPQAGTYVSLGNMLMFCGRLDESADAYRKALEMNPKLAAAHMNLGNVLTREGRLDEALAAYNHAIALDPKDSKLHTNAISLLCYLEKSDPAVVFAQHKRWGETHADALPPIGPPRVRLKMPDVLRVGYCSGDFRHHSVGFFFEPILANHDRKKFSIFCYSDVPQPDVFTGKLMKYPVTWRPIFGKTHEEAAKIMYDDDLDILVDLAGHTGGNRLLALARRPAPIQVTYLGYPNTTGIKAMDYRITDAFADPPGVTDPYHTEKLVRLPTCGWVFSATEAPEVGLPPSSVSGRVTFGTFNKIPKMSAGIVDCWARILARVRKSRMIFKSAGFQIPEIHSRFIAAFARHGVAADRLEFLNAGLPYGEHLRTYNRMDIALDTYPYSGTTTTMESLWMGVPVVTLAGKTHASRVSGSLLSAIGLGDLVAEAKDAYVEKAVALAKDTSRLVDLRAEMSQRLRPLTDARRFVAELEAAYQRMWNEKHGK